MIKCIGADNVMFVFTEEQLADLKKVVYFIETEGFVFLHHLQYPRFLWQSFAAFAQVKSSTSESKIGSNTSPLL